jgi:HrpA-like RNA helicase
LLYTIEKYSTTIVIAETGSGKTTRLHNISLLNSIEIPQYLVETGYALENKCIAITVPRRMAAISVARRVAEEMNVYLGEEVGYHIRFDEKCSEKTFIKFLTDGMLVR